MALVNGSDYDHIDMHPVSGGDVTRHMIKDAQARQDITALQVAVGNALMLNAASAEALEANTVIDNLITPGTYRVATANIASSLVTKPADGSAAGRLIVMQTSAANRYIQIYVMNVLAYPYIYLRNKNGANAEWSVWKKIAFYDDFDSTFSALQNSITKKFGLDAASAETIPADSDFNDYNTIGTYRVTTTTIAKTLLHRPFENMNAGRLIVMQTSETARLMQIYIMNHSSGVYIYARFKAGTAWPETWDKLSTGDFLVAEGAVWN